MRRNNLLRSRKIAECGFMKLGTVDRDSRIESLFVNICMVDSPSKTPLKTDTEPKNTLDLDYAQSGSNIIGGRFTE